MERVNAINVMGFMEAELERMMGAEGGDYSEEPLCVYGAAMQRVQALEAAIQIVGGDPDEIVNAWLDQ